MGDKAPHWNDCHSLQALKHLIGTLPDPSTPAPEREPRSIPGIAKRLKEQQVKSLVEEYQTGATVYELGDCYGIDRKTVSKILKREGVELRWRRLTEEDVDEAERLYATGLSAARIAERMNVHPDTILYQLKKRGVVRRSPHWRP